MNIQITSRKFRAKDSLKDYIFGEIKSLEKYYDDILDANVVLSYEHLKDNYKTAEIVLQTPGKIVKAAQTSDDFRKSISGAVDKIDKQLSKIKSKTISSKRKHSNVEGRSI